MKRFVVFLALISFLVASPLFAQID
ncbi:MAG: hypothetical protein QOJ87_27, partial [Verrucomicrobiota bacterium]